MAGSGSPERPVACTQHVQKGPRTPRHKNLQLDSEAWLLRSAQDCEIVGNITTFEGLWKRMYPLLMLIADSPTFLGASGKDGAMWSRHTADRWRSSFRRRRMSAMRRQR